MKKLLIIDEPFFPDFSEDIHYVSWTPKQERVGDFCLSSTGYSSFSFVHEIVRQQTGFSTDKIIDFFQLIDESDETGTLFPKTKITLMPNGRIYSDDEIKRHFQDILKAQDQYIHAKNIIFDMSSYTYIDSKYGHSHNKDYVGFIAWKYWERRRMGFEESWFVISDNPYASNHFLVEKIDVKQYMFLIEKD